MSDVGEDVFTQSPTGRSGLKSTAQSKDKGFSVAARPIYDTRKFRFDTTATTAVNVKSWSATKADRMSPEAAGSKLSDLMRMFGIERQDPEVCMAFVKSMLFCMAVNSSSVLTPDRAEFSVGDTDFRFLDVVRYLGSDLRRFFRAYADETVDLLKDVLNHPDQFHESVRDKRDLIMNVANDRGLSRYPHLIGDNAEACTNLAVTEHSAIALSKRSKLESNINVADRLVTGANPKTYKAFDSANAEFVDK